MTKKSKLLRSNKPNKPINKNEGVANHTFNSKFVSFYKLGIFQFEKTFSKHQMKKITRFLEKGESSSSEQISNSFDFYISLN